MLRIFECRLVSLLCITGAFAVLLPAMQNAAYDSSALLAEANEQYRTLHAAEAAQLYRDYLARYPDRADVRVYLGACLLSLNRLDQALQEAQHAVRIEPGYVKAYTLLGRIYAAKNSWDLAEQNFRQALDLDPRDRDAWYFSGEACYSSGQFEAAAKSFQEALNLGANQARVHDHLALAYDSLGQYDKAESEYRQAVELAGGDYRPFFDYGVFIFKQRRTKESISMLERAFQLQPNVPDVRFELARALYHSGQLDKAAQILHQPPASHECRVHNLLARIWGIEGNKEAAQREQSYLANCVTPDSASVPQ